MRNFFLAGLSAGALVLGLLAPTASQAGGGPPVLLTVQFPRPVIDVLVAAVPNLDEALVGESLRDGEVGARVVNQGSGRVIIQVSPDQIPPALVRDQGVVDFRVSARGPEGAWTKNLSARAVEVGGGQYRWVDPLDGAARDLDGRKSDTFSRLTDASQAAELEDDGVWVGDYSMPVYASYCVYRPWNEHYNLWATIATTYPLGKTTARALFTDQYSGRYGVAWAVAGRGWGGASGGKYTTQASSWGWAPNFVGVSRSYRVQVQYQVFHLWCAGYPGGPETFIGSEMRPTYHTGGTNVNNDIARPAWNTHCVPITQGLWWRDRTDGTAYSYSAGVKSSGLLGFDMLSEKQYSKGSRLEYDVRGTKKICGSNAAPTLAGKVIERNR